MGYSTDFEGRFSVSPAFKPEHEAYLNAFADTRRMKRDAEVTAKRPDPLREAVGLPVGPQGAYFVNEGGQAGQGEFMGSNWQKDQKNAGILDYNQQPIGQPGLWCQWNPCTDGEESFIEWDGSEKFYNYVEWIEYLIENFLKPWGYTVNGTVEWQGEERSDMGRIVIKDNEVRTQVAKVTYEYED
jgi:hypothetical protein